MAETMMVSKDLLDRLRAAFKRYGANVLGDADITIDFFPSETGIHIWVVLGSPKFQKMGITEQQDSIWDYLRSDPEVTNENLFLVSHIRMEPEAVEFIHAAN
jgi:hypothetical protein